MAKIIIGYRPHKLPEVLSDKQKEILTLLTYLKHTGKSTLIMIIRKNQIGFNQIIGVNIGTRYV